MITHTISVVEVLWTSVCAFGLFYAVQLLLRAMNDVRWLIVHDMNGLRRHAAISSVLIYMGMTMTQLGYVIIGIIAMILPSPNNKVQPLTYVITAVFITMSVFKTLISFALNRRRDELVKMVKEREE